MVSGVSGGVVPVLMQASAVWVDETNRHREGERRKLAKHPYGLYCTRMFMLP